MSTVRQRVIDGRSIGLIEFRGKYEIVMPAELRELPDEELVTLLMERGKMDESRAREVLARTRGWPQGVAYERV
jgi:hypothetical protein